MLGKRGGAPVSDVFQQLSTDRLWKLASAFQLGGSVPRMPGFHPTYSDFNELIRPQLAGSVPATAACTQLCEHFLQMM